MATQRTRWLPVLGIGVAAPWFAELPWGGFPVVDLPAILLFVGPLYGGAAILIHDVIRRSGRGWPSMLLLAAAFGVFQAGIVDQSLFNPAYGRYDFQHPAHVDGLDVSLYYLLAFVTGHVVASIGAPIALVEAWTRNGSGPWLSRRGLRVTGGVYALASLLNHWGVKEDEGHGFQATLLQTSTVLAVVLLLGWFALRWRPRPTTDGPVPRPWLLGVLACAAYLLYLPTDDAAALAVGIPVVVAAAGILGRWSRRRGWTDDHTVAVAIGTIAVGLVMPFWTEPYNPTGAGRELIADIAAATICLAVVTATLWRRRPLTRTTSGP